MATESPKTLRDVDHGVLTSLLRRFLPEPLSERPEPFLADLSEQETAVLGQILSEVGASFEKLSQSSIRTDVIKTISGLLSAGVMEGARCEAAANRLGSRGD